MPAPDALDARVRMMITSLIESAPLPPDLPELVERECRPSRQPRRWISSHRRASWVVALIMSVVVVVGIALIVDQHQTRVVSESSLGFQITNYSRPPSVSSPHLLNDILGFGFIPAGYHLIQDTQTNKITDPYDFKRSVLFGTDAGTRQRLLIMVDQGVFGYVRGTPSAPAT